MQVQDDVQIVRKGSSWELLGFKDVGHTGNLITKLEKKEVLMATHSLQYVFNGFTGFQWPVSFYATRNASAHELYLTFQEVLHALMLHGFSVDYVSMDGASTNHAFTKMMFSGPPMDILYLARNPLDSSHFIAFNKDIKHCIKKIQNGIESSREANTTKGKLFLYKDLPIVWEMWQRAFAYNSEDDAT